MARHKNDGRGRMGGKPKGFKFPKTIAKERAAEKMQAREDRSAERTLERVGQVAFGDIRRLYDQHGQLRPIHDLTESEAAMLAGFETILKNAKAGDGVTDEILKVKIRDQVKALELLMRHYRLLADTKVDEDAGDWDKRVARLHAGRDRVRKGPWRRVTSPPREGWVRQGSARRRSGRR